MVTFRSLDFRYINQEANRETAMTRMTSRRDRNNRGESLIIALGSYTGGGLWVAGSGEFDIHDNFMKFDGKYRTDHCRRKVSDTASYRPLHELEDGDGLSRRSRGALPLWTLYG